MENSTRTCAANSFDNLTVKSQEQERIRIIQYGVGAMGSNMVELLQCKPSALLVGAIDRDSAKIGRDLGSVAGLGKDLGIPVGYPAEQVLDRTSADLVLHATTAFIDKAFPQIMRVLDFKMNVITIAQELFFPLAEHQAKAKMIDEKAKDMGVSVTAIGINPGFIMDIVPIVCSAPCWEIEKVTVRRIVDFSPYGPDEMRHIGAGQSPEAFTQGVKEGYIGHIGLLETAACVAYCLGLPVDTLKQTKEPVITRNKRETAFVSIEPGMVCGFKQSVVGLQGEKEILSLNMVGLISPDEHEDGVQLGDYARIQGKPSVDISIKEEISQRGGLGTAAVAVNMIPRILEAPPGFHRMHQLMLPHIWTGQAPPEFIRTIIRQ